MADDTDTADDPVIDSNGRLVESDKSNIFVEMAMDAVYFFLGVGAMTLMGVLVYNT
jgi:hypothetical protein